jgi:cytochrome c oxidase cbb3-type subunit 3
MTFHRKLKLLAACLPALVLLLPSSDAQNAHPGVTVGSQGPMPVHAKFSTTQMEGGRGLFLQNCAFCHGKDAGGGESGPDLTRSKLVSSDKEGESLGAVIHNGRPDKGMPKFNLSEPDVLNLVAFIHSEQDKAFAQTGTRKGVDEADLQTGDAAAGKRYFEGVGGCTKCHSATSLGGVATRYTGLRLEQQMLYPRDVKSKVTVKTEAGQTFSGILAYQDEFTIAMKDASGTYRSWPVRDITFQIDDPAEAHVTALSRYSDEAIHNVFAYIQTLR